MNIFKNNNFLENLKELFLIKKIPSKVSRRELELLSHSLTIKQKLGENWFFDVCELNPEYEEIAFGFSASVIAIYNDTNKNVEFSWDGDKRHGLLYSKEDLQIDSIERDKIYLKGNGTIRIWAS